jgi:hypothetical protein
MEIFKVKIKSDSVVYPSIGGRTMYVKSKLDLVDLING